MSFTDLLFQTCTIKRHSVDSYNDYGNPEYLWSNYLVNVPCRINSNEGREIKTGAEVMIADYQLYLSKDVDGCVVDITEQDVIVIDGIAYQVLLVEAFHQEDSYHHKKALLQMIRGMGYAEAQYPAIGAEFPEHPREGELFYKRDTDELFVYTTS